jgi:hypothetical protein
VVSVRPPDPELGRHAPDEIRIRYLTALREIHDACPVDLPANLLINVATNQIADGAIATLLIQKGVFTLAEYEETSAVEAERLAVDYEQVKMR